MFRSTLFDNSVFLGCRLVETVVCIYIIDVLYSGSGKIKLVDFLSMVLWVCLSESF